MEDDNRLKNGSKKSNRVGIILAAVLAFWGFAAFLGVVVSLGNTKTDNSDKKTNDFSSADVSSYNESYGESTYSGSESSAGYGTGSSDDTSQTRKSNVKADVWYTCTSVGFLKKC